MGNPKINRMVLDETKILQNMFDKLIVPCCKAVDELRIIRKIVEKLRILRKIVEKLRII